MIEKFVESSGYSREVVDSVVQERVNQYSIKASNIAFQVRLAYLWCLELRDRHC